MRDLSYWNSLAGDGEKLFSTPDGEEDMIITIKRQASNSKNRGGIECERTNRFKLHITEIIVLVPDRLCLRSQPRKIRLALSESRGEHRKIFWREWSDTPQLTH